jgi:hypothetical protein
MKTLEMLNRMCHKQLAGPDVKAICKARISCGGRGVAGHSGNTLSFPAGFGRRFRSVGLD